MDEDIVNTTELEVSRIVQVDKEAVYSGAAAWDDYKNMQILREDIFPPGERSILAGLLSGVQVESSCTDDYKKMQGLWKHVCIFPDFEEVAELLPGMPEKTESSRTG